MRGAKCRPIVNYPDIELGGRHVLTAMANQLAMQQYGESHANANLEDYAADYGTSSVDFICAYGALAILIAISYICSLSLSLSFLLQL